MPYTPQEKETKATLDKIRVYTDLLNLQRYMQVCQPGQPMCPKQVGNLGVIVGLLKNSMLAKYKESNGFLIDGFPRNQEQAMTFEKEVARAHLVLFLSARNDTMLTRLSRRRRTDDDMEIIANRMNQFHKHTDPLKRAFGSRCKVVSAEGAPLEVFGIVNGHICNMLKEWAFPTPVPDICPSSVPLHWLRN